MALSTYHALNVGDTFSTPTVTVSEVDARTLITVGGYTHPLFTDADYAAASPFGRAPIPGQAVLLLMGGLVEQSGRFDETAIALVGLDSVRFKSPAFPGDTIKVAVEVSDKQSREGSDRGLLIFKWACTNQSNEVLAEAEARMLFRTNPEATN